jgi:hypothetical protein
MAERSPLSRCIYKPLTASSFSSPPHAHPVLEIEIKPGWRRGMARLPLRVSKTGVELAYVLSRPVPLVKKGFVCIDGKGSGEIFVTK